MTTIKERTKILMELIRSRPAYLSDKDAVEILIKSAIEGNKILRSDNADQSVENVPASLIYDYVQLLLDFSYAIETKIVNDEFSEDYKSAIETVFKYLNEGLDIIEPHMDSLTDCSRCRELCECIYWRKGALLYMYCHTSYNNQSNQMSEEGRKEQFLNYALDGVRFLAVDMTKVRKCETEQQYAASDKQALYLIQQGIFSDVNMLALMYAAEMCYWIDLVSVSKPLISSPELDHRLLGQSASEKYLHLAKGALSHANWNTSQATMINNHFQN